ncbi:MAG: DSD1 family PLP-dependent enzyme [Betaproteobacteria bacterium]|nr:DSD1 family PLP-dependent enzyme [Betaproteobacteria bacterium]
MLTGIPPINPGASIAAIDTPALVLDLDAFDRNLATMANALRGSGARLRPHAKSHKCPEIAKRQIKAGAVGICCQKVSEAEAFVDAGVLDVLVTNEIVGAAKVHRLVRLASRARIAVCVDDARNALELAAAAGDAGVVLDVLIEINVGADRCGVLPGEPALTLARTIQNVPSLRFAGLHAYQGSAQHLRSVAERRTTIERAAAAARTTKELLARAGIPCATITGAGTGSFMFEAASDVYNELQPGSYIFMDADYHANAWDGLPQFEQSLFVFTSVMSTPTPHRIVVDAGLKASSIDSGMPVVSAYLGLEFVKASDEHGVVRVADNARMPALGEQLRLIPGHCDPTVNLYDWMICIRDQRVEAVWPISARGALV